MLCPASSASPWISASCCRDGSLAVIQPLWVRQAAEGVTKARRSMLAPGWERIAAQLTLLKHLHMAVFILIIPVTYIRPSEPLALRKKNLIAPLVPLLPRWSVGIAASETGVFTKTGVRDGSVLIDQRWVQWVTKLLHWLKAGNLEEKIGNFEDPAAAKKFKPATDALGLSGLTMYQTRHNGASFRTLPEVQRRVPWKAFSSVTKAVVWRPTTTLSRPAPRQSGNTRATCRGTVDKATARLAARKCMTGRCMLDAFGGSGFLTKATIIWVCVAMCSTRNLVPGMT